MHEQLEAAIAELIKQGVATSPDWARSDPAERELLVPGSPRAHQVVKPVPGPGVAHLLLHSVCAAELERRLSSGFGFTQTGPPQLLDAAIQVVAQLTVQVEFHPPTSPGEQVEDPRQWAIPLR